MKKTQKKDYDKKIKKAGIAAISVSVLTAGTVGIVSAYQNGKDYKPSKNERDLQDNQVVFSDDEDTLGRKNDKKKEDSELLKKEKEEKNTSDKGENSGYLFENNSLLLPGNSSTTLVSAGTGLTPVNGQAQGGTTYNLTGDASDADILISGGGKGNGSGNGSGGDKNSQGSGDKTSSDQSSGKKDDNTGKKDDNNKGNKGDNPTEPDTPSQPVIRPSASVSDPDTVKKIPTSGNGINYKPFTDGITLGDTGRVIILPSMDLESSKLYKGQSVDEQIIYNALDAYVAFKSGTSYVWGSGEYGTYIRIAGISFDGGETWKEEFPVTIPKDIQEDMLKIRVEYRLSKTDENWETAIVDYDPEDTRLFVLSREVEEGETKIDEDTILNKDDQYPGTGKIVNLLRRQMDYLGGDRLTQLFPGWMEDGELVDGFYTMTEGRHILEPAAMVPLDASYVVNLKLAWMTDDYKVDSLLGNNLCYLQTLTDMDTPWRAGWDDQEWQAFASYDVLDVPKYVQAVMIDEDAGIAANYVKIPDTVLYIEIQKSGMRVKQGYIVDKDNPNYSSTEEGLLMNKEETEILNVPYSKTDITIPDTVQKIQVEKNNQLEEITIERQEDGTLPEISYQNLKKCKIVVDDALAEELLTGHQDIFSKKTGNTVAYASDPDTGYYIEEGMILDQNGNLKKVLPTSNKRIKLPDDVKKVRKNAFEATPDIETVIMPKDGKTIHFEKESLENTGIHTILCHNEQQYEDVKRQIDQYGLTDISVELLRTSKEGYEYTAQYSDGEERYVLISAPDDVTTFDGTVTAEDGSPVAITEIGENAFANNTSLTWAFLPENISVISGQAFKNCTNLQGIMIRNTEKISIGYGAIDGCDSLRFIGSNAMYAEFLDGYDPKVTDSHKMNYFYRPTYAEGYGSNCIGFVPEAGVASYDVVSDGEGGWTLYGLDDTGDPWLALRSGDTVADDLKLPETTIEIYSYAFAETKAKSGDHYTVNFADTMAWALDEGAFFQSDIGGDLALNDNSYVFDYAFSGCENLQSVEIPGDSGITLGDQIFVECTNLKSVRIGKLASETKAGTIQGGMFTGCDKLTDIYLEDEEPADLVKVISTGYRFNYYWTIEEESQHLRIHVPEGTEKDYVKAWRYNYAGYSDSSDQSAYQMMWQAVQLENINWDTWEMPEDSVVDEKLKEKLLTVENCIWTMLGKSTVSEPVDFYPYHVDDRGYINLAGAPSDVTEVNLYDTTFMGLPDGWYFDGIASNAFAGTKGLRKVILPYDLSELHNNAFAGVESDSLTLQFDEWWAIDLVLEDGKPFSFGVDDSVLHIEVPEGMEDEYIQTWSYKLAGYDDLASMRDAVQSELAADGKTPSDTDVDTEIAVRLLPQVNRLRRMMGLEEVEKLDAEAFGLNISEEQTEEQTEEQKESGPEEQTAKKAEIKADGQKDGQTDGQTEDGSQKQIEEKSEDQKTETSGKANDATNNATNDTTEEDAAGQKQSDSGKEINK